jgi:hypothetical protein
MSFDHSCPQVKSNHPSGDRTAVTATPAPSVGDGDDAALARLDLDIFRSPEMRHQAADVKRLLALGLPVIPCHAPHFETHYDADTGEQWDTVACTCGHPKCGSIGKHPRVKTKDYPPPKPSALWGWLVEADQHWQLCNTYENFARLPLNFAFLLDEGDAVALDIDPRNGGDGGLAELEARYGPLPATWADGREGGGGHRYFVNPGALPRLTSIELAPGVELLHGYAPVGKPGEAGHERGHKHIIVVPPSRHFSGGRYHWLAAPWETPLAPMPEWLIALAREKAEASKPKVAAVPAPVPRPAPATASTQPRTGCQCVSIEERARRYLAKVGPAIEGHGGDKHTFAVACKLVDGFGLDVSDALPLMREWNATCVPPWPEADLVRKLTDAIGYRRDPGRLLRQQSGRKDDLDAELGDGWRSCEFIEVSPSGLILYPDGRQEWGAPPARPGSPASTTAPVTCCGGDGAALTLPPAVIDEYAELNTFPAYLTAPPTGAEAERRRQVEKKYGEAVIHINAIVRHEEERPHDHGPRCFRDYIGRRGKHDCGRSGGGRWTPCGNLSCDFCRSYDRRRFIEQARDVLLHDDIPSVGLHPLGTEEREKQGGRLRWRERPVHVWIGPWLDYQAVAGLVREASRQAGRGRYRGGRVRPGGEHAYGYCRLPAGRVVVFSDLPFAQPSEEEPAPPFQSSERDPARLAEELAAAVLEAPAVKNACKLNGRWAENKAEPADENVHLDVTPEEYVRLVEEYGGVLTGLHRYGRPLVICGEARPAHGINFYFPESVPIARVRAFWRHVTMTVDLIDEPLRPRRPPDWSPFAPGVPIAAAG